MKLEFCQESRANAKRDLSVEVPLRESQSVEFVTELCDSVFKKKLESKDIFVGSTIASLQLKGLSGSWLALEKECWDNVQGAAFKYTGKKAQIISVRVIFLQMTSLLVRVVGQVCHGPDGLQINTSTKEFGSFNVSLPDVVGAGMLSTIHRRVQEVYKTAELSPIAGSFLFSRKGNVCASMNSQDAFLTSTFLLPHSIHTQTKRVFLSLPSQPAAT